MLAYIPAPWILWVIETCQCGHYQHTIAHHPRSAFTSVAKELAATAKMDSMPGTHLCNFVHGFVGLSK